MDTTEYQYAYLLKVQRDARAADLLASIRKPTAELGDLVLTMNDIDALAIAFEEYTPGEAARWVALLLNFDGEPFDDFTDEDDEDEFD